MAMGIHESRNDYATAGIDDSIIGKTYKDDVARIHEVLVPHLDSGREAVVVCHSYGGIPATASLEGQTIEERKSRGLIGGVKSIIYVAAAAIPQRGLSVYALQNNEWADWQEEGVSCSTTPWVTLIAIYR